MATTAQRVRGRRLQIVADRLPLFGGAQLAIDMKVVGPALQLVSACKSGACRRYGGCPTKEKNARTPNSLGNVRARDWWYWQARSGVVGLACQLAKAKARQMPMLNLRGADGDAPWAHEVGEHFLSCNVYFADNTAVIALGTPPGDRHVPLQVHCRRQLSMICVGTEDGDASFHASLETDFLYLKRFHALGCTGQIDNLPFNR